MANGWFVLVLVVCIVLCSGFVLAVALMRAAWSQREREALTASDLRALEESAVLLIDQLKSEADRAMAELDSRCADLRELLAQADSRLDALKSSDEKRSQEHVPRKLQPMASGSQSTTLGSLLDRQRVLELSLSGLECAEIARITGLDCAEVKLVLSLWKEPGEAAASGLQSDL